MVLLAVLVIAVQAAPASGLGAGGVPADGGSVFPDVSPNGRYLAFMPGAHNFDPVDTDDSDPSMAYTCVTWKPVRRSSQAGRLVLRVTRETRSSFYPTISANGRYVAFISGANNLGGGISTQAPWDIYVRDLAASTTTLVDRAYRSSGSQGETGASTRALHVLDIRRWSLRRVYVQIAPT